ncbi:MAG: hypothetical protein C5B49_16580 [Bdellovibrio sp.]|nr:MAG: hypothetical protein C5B49_16580 [Bdellovibrio sp.]
MWSCIFWGKFEEFERIFEQIPAKETWHHHATSAAVVDTQIRQHGAPNLLFVTNEVLAQNSADLLKIKAATPSISVVLTYTQPNTQENIQWLRVVPVIDHLIAMNSETTKDFIERLATPEGREAVAKNPENLFLPSGASKERTHVLKHVDECKMCYEKLHEYVERLGCFTGFSEIMTTAASEMLTNAFYNGRKNPLTGRAQVIDRRVKFGLDNNESVEFSYGQDGKYVWLMVRDSFGSLDRMTVIRALDRAATERTAKLNPETGAGLGLIMLFEWASEMGFSLVQGKSTTITCKFKMTKRQREFDSEHSAVHLVVG